MADAPVERNDMGARRDCARVRDTPCLCASGVRFARESEILEDSVERMAMRRQLVFALAVVTVLVVAAPALAKGPTRATLSGPGLESAIAVTGEGEGGTGTPLGALVDSGGFFAQVFGETPARTSRRAAAGGGGGGDA